MDRSSIQYPDVVARPVNTSQFIFAFISKEKTFEFRFKTSCE